MHAVIKSTVAVGDELPRISRQYSLKDFVRGDEKTIHTDLEAARAEGLQGPVAIGPQIAALIFRQLRQAFGQAWAEGGKCSLTFRKQVMVDEFCTAKGTVTGVDRSGADVNISCDLWIEDSRGERVIVATASAVLPATTQED